MVFMGPMVYDTFEQVLFIRIALECIFRPILKIDFFMNDFDDFWPFLTLFRILSRKVVLKGSAFLWTELNKIFYVFWLVVQLCATSGTYQVEKKFCEN